MDEICAGVIGAGVFGGFHARKYAELEGVRLFGVFDPHLERAQALTDQYGGRAFADVEALLAQVQVVTVASPADSHVAMAGRALAHGRHVYVEKPIGTDPAAVEALVRRAQAARRVLACGHQERASFAAMGLLDAPETPIQLHSVRRGTPSARSRDVSAVLDLMVHDLDLALQLAGNEVLAAHGEGGYDDVRADVVFRSGLKASFHACRTAERRERTMRLVYPSGEVEVDFLAPSFRNTTAFALNSAFAETAQGRDPLGASVAAFLAAVRGDRDRPLVTGEEGLEALDLALKVEPGPRALEAAG